MKLIKHVDLIIENVVVFERKRHKLEVQSLQLTHDFTQIFILKLS